MKTKKTTKKPKTQITKETNIIDALNINPDAADILMESGMVCIGCAMAQFETLEQGLSAHGFSKKQIDEIVGRLNKK